MTTMNRWHITYLIFFLLMGFSIQAQDVHYSQFYNMPLTLNPALTGHIEGTYRAKLIYRNQWNSITSGGVYSTPGLSADMNFKLNPESRSSFGAGLALMNDQTGGGDFTNTYALASVAYHMSLDKKEKTYLSFGVQGGYLMKRVDGNSLIFADQLDSQGNPSNTSMENLSNSNVSGGDLRLGVTFSGYPSQKMNYKFGLGYLHLIKANEVFLEGTDENKLPSRLSFFAQGEFITGNPKLRVLPQLLFMNQAKVNEINLTSNLGYKVTPDLELVFGAGYRVSDAAIANLGLNFKGVEFLASYDVNVSELTPASRANGGFEVSLGYVGRIKKPVKPELPCIRFY